MSVRLMAGRSAYFLSPLRVARRWCSQKGSIAISEDHFTVEGLRRYRDTHLRPLLAQKREELQVINQTKEHCEALARRYPNRYAAALFVLLTAQAATLFYWVYFLFDWNLVEPITYLLGYSGVWVGIAFYAMTRQELNYDSFRDLITQHYERKLFRSNKVDLEAWRRLEVEVEQLEHQLRGLEEL